MKRDADRAQRVAAYFEHFGRGDIETLGELYHADATFKDPFNDVQGLRAIQRVYLHMFDTLEDPRFTVWRCTPGDSEAWLAWRFSFGSGGSTRTVKGVSHLEFDGQGLIRSHRDYWDPAEEIYLDVPVLGWLMRAVRRKLAAPQGGNREDQAASARQKRTILEQPSRSCSSDAA